MTVPTVAFSVLRSGATPVTCVVSVKSPISSAKLTRRRLLDVQLDPILGRFKARQFGFDEIDAGRHRREREGADLRCSPACAPRWSRRSEP